MTGKMLRGLQHHALMKIFEGMKRGNRDGHRTRATGRTTERTDDTKAYEFGDSISELDLGTTMRNAVARQLSERAASGGSASGGASLPIRINSGDFEVHQTEGTGRLRHRDAPWTCPGR